jgi:hypothetical protein
MRVAAIAGRARASSLSAGMGDARLDSAAKNLYASVAHLGAGRQRKPLWLWRIATLKEFFAKAN